MDIEEIKQLVRIEEVAGRYGKLHRAGANYKMICPFHDDTHPSLTIHTGKQFFKCHACGEGGDVFKLVQRLENCTFAEAVDRLRGKTQNCRQTSGTARGKERSADKVEQSTSQQVQKADTSAEDAGNERFLSLLMPYATGISELTPVYLDFEVGMAPMQISTMPGGDGRRFHPLRGRLIFPIRDMEGKLIGFGGRRIDNADSQSPKYINSANSAVFDKSMMLYGIHRAKEAIIREGFVYIVEGYKDVLAMHAAGYHNTVGLGGTALTIGQAGILKGMTTEIVLLLDGDPAGEKAMGKIREGNPDLSFRSGFFPEGDDPDSLFHRLGTERFRQYIAWVASPAGICERRLLNFCLKYPVLAGRMEKQLEQDDLPFTDPVLRDLLHAVARGERLDELSPTRQGDHKQAVSTFPPLPTPPVFPAALLAEPEIDIMNQLAEYYRLSYYEERLQQAAYLQVQIIREAVPGERKNQYLRLNDIRKQLTIVQKFLGRMVCGK